MKEYHRDL